MYSLGDAGVAATPHFGATVLEDVGPMHALGDVGASRGLRTGADVRACRWSYYLHPTPTAARFSYGSAWYRGGASR